MNIDTQEQGMTVAAPTSMSEFGGNENGRTQGHHIIHKDGADLPAQTEVLIQEEYLESRSR